MRNPGSIPRGVLMWNRDSPVSVVSLHWWPWHDWSLWPRLRQASSQTVTRPSSRQCDNPTWSHIDHLSQFHAHCRNSFRLHNRHSRLLGGALWRACNLTVFIHSSIGPVVHQFASRHEGPRFNPQGVLMWNQDSPVRVVSLHYFDLCPLLRLDDCLVLAGLCAVIFVNSNSIISMMSVESMVTSMDVMSALAVILWYPWCPWWPWWMWCLYCQWWPWWLWHVISWMAVIKGCKSCPRQPWWLMLIIALRRWCSWSFVGNDVRDVHDGLDGHDVRYSFDMLMFVTASIYNAHHCPYILMSMIVLVIVCQLRLDISTK